MLVDYKIAHYCTTPSGKDPGVYTYLEDHVSSAAIKVLQVIHTPLKTARDVLANSQIFCQPCALLGRKIFWDNDDGTGINPASHSSERTYQQVVAAYKNIKKQAMQMDCCEEFILNWVLRLPDDK